MSRIRVPRDIVVYLRSDEAIRRLEQIARVLKERRRDGDLMKWDMTLWFFNENWNNGPRSENNVCSRTRFKSGREGPARIGQTVAHRSDALVTGQ